MRLIDEFCAGLSGRRTETRSMTLSHGQLAPVAAMADSVHTALAAVVHCHTLMESILQLGVEPGLAARLGQRANRLFLHLPRVGEHVLFDFGHTHGAAERNDTIWGRALHSKSQQYEQ